MKKQLIYLSPDCFFDTDAIVLRHLAAEYDVTWVALVTAIGSRVSNVAVVEAMARQAGVKLVLKKLYWRRLSWQQLRFDLGLLGELKSLRADLVYIEDIGDVFFYLLQPLFLKKRTTVHALHDVVPHSGRTDLRSRLQASLFNLTRWLLMSWARNFHIFSRTEFAKFRELYPSKNAFYTRLLLKSFGTPVAEEADVQVASGPGSIEADNAGSLSFQEEGVASGPGSIEADNAGSRSFQEEGVVSGSGPIEADNAGSRSFQEEGVASGPGSIEADNAGSLSFQEEGVASGPGSIEAHCRLLFFGLIEYYKGLDLLIESIEALVDEGFTNFSLTIAGKGTHWPQCETLIRSSRHYDLRIRYIPDEEIPGLFAGHHFIVLPYRDASQSGPQMISLEYSLPVIASDVDGLSEFIVNEESGFIFSRVPGQSLHTLTDRLRQCLTMSDQHYTGMRQRLSEWKQQHYRIDDTIARYVSFFTERLEDRL